MDGDERRDGRGRAMEIIFKVGGPILGASALGCSVGTWIQNRLAAMASSGDLHSSVWSAIAFALVGGAFGFVVTRRDRSNA